MPLKAILFDLDGTLVDSDPIHRAVFAEILAPLGHVVDEEFFRTKISGGRNEVIFKRFFPELDAAGIARKADLKEEMFREQAKGLLPMPGLDRIMGWARQHGLKMALVTNAPRGNVDFMLRAIGLRDAFDLEIIADETPKGKPDPAPYLAALEQLAIAADEAVVFEDSGTGIKSSVGAKIFTYGLMSTHPAEDLLHAGADMVVADYADPALWQDLHNRLGR